MSSFGLLYSIWLFLLLATCSITALPQCYYPDGTADSTHVPCNQTISDASACCNPRDACTASGFCLGRSGWQYRGSCTDQTWGSANCPKQFSTCVTDPSTNRPYGKSTAVWMCSPIPTLLDGKFCCDYSNGSSCCGSQFSGFLTGTAFKPGVDAREAEVAFLAVARALASMSGSIIGTTTLSVIDSNTSPTAAGSTLTASSASTTGSASTAETSGTNKVLTECPKNNVDLGTKVGLGVGIPLGVLVASLLAFLMWRECSKQRSVTTPTQNSEAMTGFYGGDKTPSTETARTSPQTYQGPRSRQIWAGAATPPATSGPLWQGESHAGGGRGESRYMASGAGRSSFPPRHVEAPDGRSSPMEMPS